MRKYVAPCAVLLGLALLSPRANAAVLILKSAAVPPAGSSYTVGNDPAVASATGNGSMAVSAITIGGSGQLWGLDMALVAPAGITARTDASSGAAFVPSQAGFSGGSATDVVVSGTTFVGSGTQPNIYVGYLRGAAAMTTSDATQAGVPENSIGLLKLNVGAAAATYPYTDGANGTRVVLNIAPIGTYNVKNSVDGSGNPVDSARAGTTAVTSTTTAGAPVVAEAVTVADQFPGYAPPAGTDPDFRVPLHKLAVGAPGDVDGNGSVAGNDASIIARTVAGIAGNVAGWADYKRITGDVFPYNGYVPVTNLQGTGAAGGSYGDGVVSGADASQIARFVAGIASTQAGFPRPE